MKKLLLSLLLVSSAFASTLFAEFESTLEDNLTFPGTVTVTYAADAYVGHVVYFDVTSYGETRRGAWCYIVEDEVVECNVDWFKK